MPRESKLRFWARRQVYYCQIAGERHYLGRNKKLAEKQFHSLMAKTPKKRPVAAESVVVLIDRFLEYVQKNLAADTYVWYQSRLDLFANRYPDLLLAELRKNHVREWIDSYDVAPGTKRNYARAIIRCLNWCEEEELIDGNPLRRFKKPPSGKRDKVVSEEEYALILSLVRNDAFRDLLVVSWETGCRPQESLTIEARHVDLTNSRWWFPGSESKGKKHDRVVYLTEKAEEITRRLMLRYPEGPLFRNAEGKPWTTDTVNCAFIGLQTRLGLRKLPATKTARKRIPAAQKEAHAQAVRDRCTFRPPPTCHLADPARRIR